jgi:transposase
VVQHRASIPATRVRFPPPALSSGRAGTFSVVKTAERELARRMRRYEGRSIKEIARLVGVSKSSVSLWVRDIELSDEQHAALQARNGLHERQRLANAAMSAKARIRRIAAQDDGRWRAKQADKLYVMGCMLY